MNRSAEPPLPLEEGWGEGYVRSPVCPCIRTLSPLGRGSE
jgi:hypothetical protein